MSSVLIAIDTFIQEDENSATVNKLIAKIEVYSAIKIKAKGPLLYSVLKPDTSSDSPSAKSKGVRLVSASIVTNQIKKTGNKVKPGQKKEWKELENMKDSIRRRGARSIKAIETS